MKLSHSLVLASSSEVRERILRDLAIPFNVIRPKFDEATAKESMKTLCPKEQSKALARGKAKSVNDIHGGWLVIGADQVCECEDRILEKPGNVEKAVETLKFLSGKTHYQHSAISLYHHGECIWETVETAELTMRTLSSEEILAYLDMDRPFNACGAYHFEGRGKHLFSEIKGNDDVILGLPASALLARLYEDSFLQLAA